MKLDFEFKTSNNKEYDIDSISNSTVYIKESAIGQLALFYYLVL